MAESSAKSGDERADDCRAQFGAQVVLLNARFRSLPDAPDASHLFDQSAWPAAQPVTTTGRGANWFVEGGGQFVLRHFRRGGAVARLLGNKYWFSGEDATRSIAEFRLLQRLRDLDLPVPEPVAAGYCKRGLWYTAQLLTRRIPDAHSWSADLGKDTQDLEQWSTVGRTVARLHNAYVDHADLNAHNILVDTSARVFIIDFDKSTLRETPEGGWRQANLARLKRSLHKILPGKGTLIDDGWSSLMAAYEAELGGSR